MAVTSVPWLINIARRASLSGVETLRPDPRTPLADSWRAVAQACGITPDELVLYVANGFRMKPADFRTSQQRALKLVPEKMIREHQILPMREDDKVLVVATSDPTNPEVEQAIGFASGRRAEFEVAAPDTLRLAIESRFAPDEMVDRLLQAIDASGAELVSFEQVSEFGENADAFRVRTLTNLILKEAVRQGATHVHLEPGGAGAVVRFRIDGTLRHPTMQLPMLALSKVIARLNQVTGAGAGSRFDGREGQGRVRVAGQNYELRVFSTQTRDGERAVIRIIDPQSALWLQDLGIDAPELARLRRLLTRKNGLIVISAPPQAGATTTAYAAMRELSGDGRSVAALEDRIEYDLPGVSQTQVDFARKAAFISALSEALRDSPDVLFVSDIRDTDAARAAIETAAERLVVVTMHTASTAAVIERFTDLGIDRERLASVFRGAVAERLIRKLCPACGQPGQGCVRCANTGYKGRRPILEVLVSSPEIAQKIESGASAQEIESAAVQGGMRTLKQVGDEAARAGETSPSEVERVLGSLEVPQTRKTHVLVVDDDAVTRLFVRQLLENQGYTVSEASDGVIGLEHIEAADDLALVVLDIEMPHLGGREVLTRIRRNIATHALPVVVLTGLEGRDTEAQLMELGADDYLRKPIDEAHFAPRVNAALRRASG